MKLKNLTIAIAMASLTTASFAAQADTKTSFYGSVRLGIGYEDVEKNGVSTDSTKLKNWGSRMGFKGETDLSNGITAFGHYEFGVDTDPADNENGALSTRKAYVGLKGDFGRIRLGQDTHTFYNTVIAPADQAWDGSMYGADTLGTYTGRSGEALTYDTNLGPVGLGVTSYMGDDEYEDGYEVGATFKVGPVKLGIGAQDTDYRGGKSYDGDPVYGVSAGGEVGAFTYGLAYTDWDKVGTSIDAHLGIGDGYVAIGQADLDAGTKPKGVTLGYTYKIGKQTSAWFEAQRTDDDAGTEATTLKAALKYDF